MADLNESGQQIQVLLKCEICDKEYKNRNGLRVHFVKFHEEQKGDHQCNVCDLKFSQQSQLISHTKIVHENLVEDLDICPEILFSSAQSLFALLKGRANKDQNFLFVFHYSHSA